MDLARAVERDSDAFCRQGYGALLAKLAAGLPVRLSTPVTRIVLGRNGWRCDTPEGQLRARAVIVTVSTNVLASDKIEFSPALPKRQLDAAAKLSLGSYDHIALDMPGNPLGLQRDDMVFEQSTGTRTAALLANVSAPACIWSRSRGSFGRELSAKGEAAMVDFAGDWLASLFGSDVKRAIKRSHATRWNDRALGARRHVGAAPGNADARKILMEPLGGTHLVCRRGGARDAMGHGRRRLGIGHARGRSGAAQDGRAEGAGRGQAGAPSRERPRRRRTEDD